MLAPNKKFRCCECEMPVLKNAKYEIFAQERAKGASASDAYERAGYTRHDGNAHRLSVNEKVTARVDEILSKSAERTGVTVDRIVSELAKIGFADIRKVMRWGESVALPIGENGEVFVSHDVALVSSDDLDDATAAAVSEVRKRRKGCRSKCMISERPSSISGNILECLPKNAKLADRMELPF
jgi:phage terminase small subunit